MRTEPIHVLLVEDNPGDARLIRELLAEDRNTPHRVTHVVRLSEGLARLAEGGVDIVLLDLTLPDSQGLESARRLLEVGPDVPVVIWSGDSDETVALKAVQEGAQDFLLKSQVDGNSVARSIRYAIERKQLLVKLDQSLRDQQASQTDFRNVINRNPDGIIVLDTGGVVLFLNLAAESLFGRKSDELVGEVFSLPLKSGEGTEIELVDGDKKPRTVNVWLVEIEWDGQPAYLISLHDLTERKKAEEGLRKSEDENRALLDAMPDLMFRISKDGTYVDFKVAKDIELYLPPSEFLGKKVWEVLPKDVAELCMHYTERALQTDVTQVFEYQLPLNGSIRDYEARVVHSRNDEVLSIVRDITERKQAEEALRASEEKLRQSQKMEAIGQLAGGVAHDFNNLLTTITGYSQLVLSDLGPDDPMRPDLEGIQKAGERAASLTRQLLAFSRKQVLRLEVLDLNGVVTNISKMLRRMIGEDIQLVTALEPALERVKADPGQIEQVIMNLAVNGRDAMPEGGKLVIETTNVKLDESLDRGPYAIPPGRYVMLAVSDSGCGMDRETLDKVFEPFFTTKERDKGTGLGLSTVYGIVKQSGGSIWVYSEPGEGSTFKIYLPRVEELAPSSERDETPAATSHGSETVLLVEDEEPVRMVVRRVLERNGYRVLEARNGVEALEVSARHSGPIHLMLTDVIMPDMGGKEAAERLGPSRPEMKVLYLSGYPSKAIVHHGKLEPGQAYLQKPFTMETLSRRVREVLDGEAQSAAHVSLTARDGGVSGQDA